MNLPPTNPPQHWWEHEERWPYEQQANRGMSSALLTILTSASQHLIAHARYLATRDSATELQLAVIFAQSACELHTEKALDDLLRPLTPTKLNEAVRSTLRRPVTLADNRAYRFWTALTDDAARDQPWWSDWKATRDLRNDVAHEGKAVMAADAARCIAQADEYMGHISRIVAATLARPR